MHFNILGLIVAKIKQSSAEVNLTRVAFMLSEKKYIELKIVAASKKLTIREIITNLINDYLKENKKF